MLLLLLLLLLLLFFSTSMRLCLRKNLNKISESPFKCVIWLVNMHNDNVRFYHLCHIHIHSFSLSLVFFRVLSRTHMKKMFNLKFRHIYLWHYTLLDAFPLLTLSLHSDKSQIYLQPHTYYTYIYLFCVSYLCTYIGYLMVFIFFALFRIRQYYLLYVMVIALLIAPHNFLD